MKAFESIVLTVILATFLGACSKDSKPNKPKDEIRPISQTAQSDSSWQKDYPNHWWKPVPRDQASSWEILPQDAGFKEVILSKRNELGLLSNFGEAPFVYHGVCYPTVEAFWQMMKYPELPDDPRWQWTAKWKFTRQQVSQMSGFTAKSAGSYANSLMDNNKANWITFEGRVIPFYTKTPQEHYRLIWEALIEKIRQNPSIRETLLRTKGLKLKPDHSISEQSPREWHYNELWMEIRDLIETNKLSLETNEDLKLRTCKGLNN